MFKYLRYFGTHVLILAAAIGFLLGNSWYWLGFLAGVFVWIGGDALSGPIAKRRVHYEQLFILDLALYGLLPSLVLLCIALAWATSSQDLFAIGSHIFASFNYDALAARATAGAVDYVGACLSFGLAIAMGGILTAHELMHRTKDPVSMWFARWMLAVAFNASLEVAHVYGHHRDVGTLDDPATAQRGESVYRFFIRSTIGQFGQAWRIENQRLENADGAVRYIRNKVIRGVLRSGLVAGLFYLAGGVFTLSLFLASSVWNKFLLESLNYLEHYGLVRVSGTAIEPRHAWDSENKFSHAALFNLPWHADHHCRAGVHYQALAPSKNAPMLGIGYLASLPLVWIPPVWRRLIEPKLAQWDANLASTAEQALARSRR